MPLLIYFLLLLPTVLLGVFLYYRGLVWLGENIQREWLRTILVFIFYLLTIFFWLTGTFLLIILTSPPSAPDFLTQMLMSTAVFIAGAILFYKRYKIRLDASGIFFGR